MDFYLEELFRLSNQSYSDPISLYKAQEVVLFHQKNCILLNCPCHFMIKEDKKKLTSQDFLNLIDSLFKWSLKQKALIKDTAEWEQISLKFITFSQKYMNNPTSTYYHLKNNLSASKKNGFQFTLISEIFAFRIEKLIEEEISRENQDQIEQKINPRKMMHELSNQDKFRETIIPLIADFLIAKIKFWNIFKDFSLTLQSLSEHVIELSNNFENLSNLFRKGFNQQIHTENSDLSKLMRGNDKIFSITFKVESIFKGLVQNQLEKARNLEIKVQELLKKDTFLEKEFLCSLAFLKGNAINLQVSLICKRGYIINKMNKKILNFFGFDQGEEQNIVELKQLMPSFISQIHNDLMFNLIGKGKSTFFNGNHQMFALSKGKFMFPIKIQIEYMNTFLNDFVLNGCILKLQTSNEYILIDEYGIIKGITKDIHNRLFSHLIPSKVLIDEKLVKVATSISKNINIAEAEIFKVVDYLNLIFIFPQLIEILSKIQEREKQILNNVQRDLLENNNQQEKSTLIIPHLLPSLIYSFIKSNENEIGEKDFSSCSSTIKGFNKDKDQYFASIKKFYLQSKENWNFQKSKQERIEFQIIEKYLQYEQQSTQIKQSKKYFVIEITNMYSSESSKNVKENSSLEGKQLFLSPFVQNTTVKNSFLDIDLDLNEKRIPSQNPIYTKILQNKEKQCHTEQQSSTNIQSIDTEKQKIVRLSKDEMSFKFSPLITTTNINSNHALFSTQFPFPETERYADTNIQTYGQEQLESVTARQLLIDSNIKQKDQKFYQKIEFDSNCIEKEKNKNDRIIYNKKDEMEVFFQENPQKVGIQINDQQKQNYSQIQNNFPSSLVIFQVDEPNNDYYLRNLTQQNSPQKQIKIINRGKELCKDSVQQINNSEGSEGKSSIILNTFQDQDLSIEKAKSTIREIKAKPSAFSQIQASFFHDNQFIENITQTQNPKVLKLINFTLKLKQFLIDCRLAAIILIVCIISFVTLTQMREARQLISDFSQIGKLKMLNSQQNMLNIKKYQMKLGILSKDINDLFYAEIQSQIESSGKLFQSEQADYFQIILSFLINQNDVIEETVFSYKQVIFLKKCYNYLFLRFNQKVKVQPLEFLYQILNGVIGISSQPSLKLEDLYFITNNFINFSNLISSFDNQLSNDSVNNNQQLTQGYSFLAGGIITCLSAFLICGVYSLNQIFSYQEKILLLIARLTPQDIERELFILKSCEQQLRNSQLNLALFHLTSFISSLVRRFRKSEFNNTKKPQQNDKKVTSNILSSKLIGQKLNKFKLFSIVVSNIEISGILFLLILLLAFFQSRNLSPTINFLKETSAFYHNLNSAIIINEIIISQELISQDDPDFPLLDQEKAKKQLNSSILSIQYYLRNFILFVDNLNDSLDSKKILLKNLFIEDLCQVFVTDPLCNLTQNSVLPSQLIINSILTKGLSGFLNSIIELINSSQNVLFGLDNSFRLQNIQYFLNEKSSYSLSLQLYSTPMKAIELLYQTAIECVVSDIDNQISACLFYCIPFGIALIFIQLLIDIILKNNLSKKIKNLNDSLVFIPFLIASEEATTQIIKSILQK